MKWRSELLMLAITLIIAGLCSAFGQTEKVLWSVGNTPIDGAFPTARLARDKAGNLYGTTELSGTIGEGTTFELSHQKER